MIAVGVGRDARPLRLGEHRSGRRVAGHGGQGDVGSNIWWGGCRPSVSTTKDPDELVRTVRSFAPVIRSHQSGRYRDARLRYDPAANSAAIPIPICLMISKEPEQCCWQRLIQLTLTVVRTWARYIAMIGMGRPTPGPIG